MDEGPGLFPTGFQHRLAARGVPAIPSRILGDRLGDGGTDEAVVEFLSPACITFENNEKIRPQPDRENAFARTGGGGDGPERQPSLKARFSFLLSYFLYARRRPFVGSSLRARLPKFLSCRLPPGLGCGSPDSGLSHTLDRHKRWKHLQLSHFLASSFRAGLQSICKLASLSIVSPASSMKVNLAIEITPSDSSTTKG
ncbi:hypothetical protein [Paracoccus sp. S-4012]|uniref:hypothetical protein n=1 Tax=Paracoccus sp. S-4012 TaxID=2665648 RepID=UPI001E5BFD82|nr:hypothetical protein [Paracoccus sp. S-4012]